MNSILGWIILGVVIIALIQFPLGQVLSGNMDLVVNVGYPWHFLEFSLLNTDASPLLPMNLIFDLILYIIVAYIINVILNLMFNSNFTKTEEEKKQQPVVFKDRKSTISDKLTKKVFEPQKYN